MPLKVLEWIKCLDFAQQALLIIFSQTTTTRLSKELLACVWPDTHLHTQTRKSLLAILQHEKKSFHSHQQHNVLALWSDCLHTQHVSPVMWCSTCVWVLLPPPPPPPVPPVPPPAPPLPALLGCWWLAISAILLSICSKRSRIDILNWLSG